MFHRTFKQLAVVAFAGASFCFASAQRPAAAEWVPVNPDAVYDDECDEPRPSYGQSLCRKLRLHGAYARRAFSCRYISLPYTQPNSIMYYSPSAAGYGTPNMPGTGSIGGYPGTGYPGASYPGSNGYGASGYGPSPAYAAPGSVFIR